MKFNLYSESAIRPILRQELSREKYEEIMKKLGEKSTVPAIPEGYIRNYARRHDAVCQGNLNNLISRFHLDTGGENGDALTD